MTNCIVVLAYSRPECLWLCLESLRRARGIEKYHLYFSLNDDCHPDIPKVIKQLCNGLVYEIEQRGAGWLIEHANGEAIKGAADRSESHFVMVAEDEEVSADYLEMVEYCVSHFDDGNLLAVPGGYVLPPPATDDAGRLVKSSYVSTVGTAVMVKPFRDYAQPFLNWEYYTSEHQDVQVIAQHRADFFREYFPEYEQGGEFKNIFLTNKDYQSLVDRFGQIGANERVERMETETAKAAHYKADFFEKHFPEYERNVVGIDGILHRCARRYNLFSLIPLVRRVHEIGFYGTHYPFNKDIFLTFHALKSGELKYLCHHCEEKLEPDFEKAEYRCRNDHVFSMRERYHFKAIYQGLPISMEALRQALSHTPLNVRVAALKEAVVSGEIKALFRNVPFYEALEPDHKWQELYIGPTPCVSFHLLHSDLAAAQCWCPQPIPIGELQTVIGGAVAHAICDGYLGVPREDCIVEWKL